MIQFEWDKSKERSNRKKHKVSFNEAASAFYDPNARFIPEKSSEEEERFLLMGMSVELRLLVVCHCVKEDGDVIRIISARKASKSERRQYGDFL